MAKHNKKINSTYRHDDDDIPDHIKNAGEWPRMLQVRFKTREDLEEFERLSGYKVPTPPPTDPDDYAKYLAERPPRYYAEMKINSKMNILDM